MAVNRRREHFQIEVIKEADWPWVLKNHEETGLESLSPERRQEIDPQRMRQRLRQQVARIRGRAGFPNQAFVARGKPGQRMGFIWVAEIRDEVSDQTQAFVLDIYVAKCYRGQGLGRCLMETAEEWARQRSLQRIALSVAVHNAPARRLYERIGYQAEMLRMSKQLVLVKRKDRNIQRSGIQRQR